MSSKKRIRELFQQEMDEKTFFEFRVTLDGTLARPREIVVDGDDNIYVDEEGDFYPEEETIVFRFDTKVRRELSKTLRRILKDRKLPPLESITLDHPEVRAAIKNYGGRNKVDPNTKERIRQEVVSKFEPEYNIALYEVILLSMVERDLFSPKINRGQINVTEKMEVIVPDDFWTSQSPEIEEDEDDQVFNQLKFGNHVEKLEPIIRNKSNPLEYMIAVVDTLIMDNDALSDVAGELAQVVTANVFISANREAVIADGLDPFRQRLEAFLPRIVGNRDDNGNWTESSGGVRVLFGGAGAERQSEAGNPADSGDAVYASDGEDK